MAEPVAGFAVPVDPSASVLEAKQTFRIGKHWFFTGFDEATELVSPMTAFWLPNTPAWCQGLANSNSYLVPVVDLLHAAAIANAPEAAFERPESPRFHLIFGTAAQRIAVAIDSLPFTIASVDPAAHTTLDLPGVWANVVDFSVPWQGVASSFGAAHGAWGESGPPEFVHHLSGARLAQWFFSFLHPTP